MKRIILKTFHGLIFILYIFLYFISFPPAYILYKRKHIWLISEVYFDARDNGYHFFKYLNDNYKTINSVYIISKKNKYFGKINKIGKSVEPGSYKHLLYFIASDYKIATLTHGCSPSYYLTLFLLKFHPTGKNISLKHGVFKNIHPNYFKKNAHLDMICCGGLPEYEFIRDNFGYKNSVAKYTGLARFDNLHNHINENCILIMPTWRRTLDGVDEESFVSSLYFTQWTTLLKKIIDAVPTDFQIYYYVHHKMNKYVHLFREDFSNISFINSADGDDLQTYLMKCKLFITDFSSTFFDIAYMKKPAIYFQFDEEEYYKTHYEKAYFDYNENGFGPVVDNVDDCIVIIKNVLMNDCKVSEQYLKRINEFFTINDNNNCKRIFDEIIKL